MILIVAGSRHLTDQSPVIARFLSTYPQPVNLILTGGARGVDSSVHGPARAYGMPVEVVPADWQTHGRKAGPLRNRAMAKRADVLLLIWDGKSRGSASMKREAAAHGLEIHEIIVGDKRDAKGFRGMAEKHGLTLHEHGDGQARIDAIGGYVDDPEDEGDAMRRYVESGGEIE